MNLLRILTGTIIGLIVFGVIWTGGLLFSFSIILVGIISSWEFYKLVVGYKIDFNFLVIFSLGIINAVILILLVSKYGMTHVPLQLSLNIILAAFFSIVVFEKNSKIPIAIIKQLFGLIYILIPLVLLLIVRNDEYGFEWSLMTLCLVASGDIAAYYFGKLFGRNKLCPHVSPGKTIEGSLSGLFFNSIVVIFFKFYFFPFISIYILIPFAITIGIVAQIGDLFVSEFKRLVNVKDSGKLLPGHGGFLDRIDAFLMAMPVSYLFYMCIKFSG